MINLFKKKKEKLDNLDDILKEFNSLKEAVNKISSEIENLKKKNEFSIQKMGVIRYNPFSEVGSDQSFSVALLDGNNNGIVITSLYSRDGNRVYGKPVKNSESDYLLSEEEKKAILEAKNLRLK